MLENILRLYILSVVREKKLNSERAKSYCFVIDPQNHLGSLMVALGILDNKKYAKFAKIGYGEKY